MIGKKGDIDKNCQGKTCNPIGLQDQKDAWNLSTASTIAFVAGGVLAIGGAVLFFTAPKAETQAALRVVPGGAILEGTW